MTLSHLSRFFTAVVLGAALCASASAQLFGSFGFGANVFDTKGLDSDKIPSQQCTGFYKTPNFKCEAIKVPVYFARVKDGDRRALVVILPGAVDWTSATATTRISSQPTVSMPPLSIRGVRVAPPTPAVTPRLIATRAATISTSPSTVWRFRLSCA
ncbi:hypothetical protein [Variovorax sp. E3]|uniref:hypothetical protein n=1 Tax=Variovorax sp. E3 TaxID=1914993 RepID=UPI0018DE711C|nr:hypothetical protein [Variovorax sp. E3]